MARLDAIGLRAPWASEDQDVAEHQRRQSGDGEQPSGVQRAAAAADFGNGISWVLPFEQWIFLNPDLTLHLARPPVGEWIGLDAFTLPSDQGMAMAESAVGTMNGSSTIARKKDLNGRCRLSSTASHRPSTNLAMLATTV